MKIWWSITIAAIKYTDCLVTEAVSNSWRTWIIFNPIGVDNKFYFVTFQNYYAEHFGCILYWKWNACLIYSKSPTERWHLKHSFILRPLDWKKKLAISSYASRISLSSLTKYLLVPWLCLTNCFFSGNCFYYKSLSAQDNSVAHTNSICSVVAQSWRFDNGDRWMDHDSNHRYLFFIKKDFAYSQKLSFFHKEIQ